MTTVSEYRADSPAELRMQELYRAHARPLFGYLLRLTFGNAQDAEDLVQETLLRAWRSRDRLDCEVAALRPWLYTVARRLAIDAVRARQARPAELTGVDVTRLAGTEDVADQVTTAVTVQAGLRKLTPEQRDVLVELHYRGQTTAMVAEKLDIPQGTVRSRAFYALRAMRLAVGA